MKKKKNHKLIYYKIEASSNVDNNVIKESIQAGKRFPWKSIPPTFTHKMLILWKLAKFKLATNCLKSVHKFDVNYQCYRY